jgi:hypothetical protein
LAASDTNAIIDVMFVFTPQAVQSVGGTLSAMTALVTMAVQIANDAYQNSNSPLRMRAVSVAASLDTDYVEKGFEQELIRMRFTNDGYFDQDFQARRASLGADAVVLFVASTSYCGLAYMWATVDTAVAVVSTMCPDSVAHEIGHTIGLDHDRVTAQNFVYSQYNFGYCWDISATSCRRSMMAYAGTCLNELPVLLMYVPHVWHRRIRRPCEARSSCTLFSPHCDSLLFSISAGCVTTNRRTNCPRAPYFSSPLTVQGALGRTTGIATSDNARVLREQATRAVTWTRSTTPGGLIFSVTPAYAVLGRCEAVTISGWRIGVTGSDITSVTLNGVPALRIVSQSVDSVQVLADRSASAGTGDVVVTTTSGYTTTLRDAFTYEQTSGNFTADFEDGTLGPLWTSTGILDWTVQRYCTALPCDVKPRSGPAVGVNGTGYFARAMAYDDSPVSSSLTTAFSTTNGACVESIQSVSLYYHLWNPQGAQCRGSLIVETQNRVLQWSTVKTATVAQVHQNDSWLPLHHRFTNPTNIIAVRITAVPYVGPSTCYLWGSVSVDQITITKTTTCPEDNCGFVSASPTIAITSAPTPVPSTQRPTTYRPTSYAPSFQPTPVPSLTPVPAVEVVQFTCAQVLSGITAAQFLADSNNNVAFLSTVAKAMNASTDDLCCLTVADQSSGLRLHLLSTAAIRLSYQITMMVACMLSPSGSFDPAPGALSPVARAAFNTTTHLLMASIAQGAFQSSLAAASPSMASVTTVPLSNDSFSTPTSFVYRLSGAPSMTPTIAAAPAPPAQGLVEWSTAAFVVLAVILIALIGAIYGLSWVYMRHLRKDAKSPAPVPQGSSKSAPRDKDPELGASSTPGSYADLLGAGDTALDSDAEDSSDTEDHTEAEDSPAPPLPRSRSESLGVPATPRNLPRPQSGRLPAPPGPLQPVGAFLDQPPGAGNTRNFSFSGGYPAPADGLPTLDLSQRLGSPRNGVRSEYALAGYTSIDAAEYRSPRRVMSDMYPTNMETRGLGESPSRMGSPRSADTRAAQLQSLEPLATRIASRQQQGMPMSFAALRPPPLNLGADRRPSYSISGGGTPALGSGRSASQDRHDTSALYPPQPSRAPPPASATPRNFPLPHSSSVTPQASLSRTSKSSSSGERNLPLTQTSLAIINVQGTLSRTASLDLDHDREPAPRPRHPTSLLAASFMAPPSATPSAVSAYMSRMSSSETCPAGHASSGSLRSATVDYAEPGVDSPKARPENFRAQSMRLSAASSATVVVASPRNRNTAHFLQPPPPSPRVSGAVTNNPYDPRLAQLVDAYRQPPTPLAGRESHSLYRSASIRQTGHRELQSISVDETLARSSPPALGLSGNFKASALVPPPIRIADPAEQNFGSGQMISPVSITTTTPSAVQAAVGRIEHQLVKQGSSRKLGSPGGSMKQTDSSNRSQNASPRHYAGQD